MGRIYFDGSIMIVVGAEERAGKQQSNKLSVGQFFP
jgi:hypothetical protein